MNRHLLLACLSFALVVAPAISSAAGPVYKCVIQGTLTFQSTPCPTGESRPQPSIEQLNAERQRRASEAARSAPRSPPGAAAPSAARTPEPAPAGRDARVLPRPASPAVAQASRCDGRKLCSQMTSCDEAKFFLRNCPGVMMDGDGDGIPCEEQWCRRP